MNKQTVKLESMWKIMEGSVFFFFLGQWSTVAVHGQRAAVRSTGSWRHCQQWRGTSMLDRADVAMLACLWLMWYVGYVTRVVIWKRRARGASEDASSDACATWNGVRCKWSRISWRRMRSWIRLILVATSRSGQDLCFGSVVTWMEARRWGIPRRAVAAI